MKQRGFLLVSVLLISIILLVLGMTFLGKRTIQYRRATLFEEAARARALADAGLEDCLAKLRRDLEFPPLSKDQTVFSYAEEVVVGGTRVGRFRVVMDGTRRFAPFGIWLITSHGEAGSDPQNPTSVRTYRAEVDIYPHDRSNKAAGNPYYYDIINFQDMGGLMGGL